MKGPPLLFWPPTQDLTGFLTNELLPGKSLSFVKSPYPCKKYLLTTNACGRAESPIGGPVRGAGGFSSQEYGIANT